MRQSTKILIFLSLFIAISDATFVFINYRNSKTALDKSLQVQGQEQRQSFELTLDDIERAMALMATYVSNDPRVSHLFLEGVQAAKAEGGGPGGPKTAVLRQKLFDLVTPGWQEVTTDFKVRQLHFHMGPGSTSFLRVHKPSRFGDTMHECRYTVVAVNKNLEPVTGFETGRVVSGIRGVVPVFSIDPESGEKIHAGALEAGTSFDTILPDLARRLSSGIAVLLTEKHVHTNIWPEMMSKAFKDTSAVEGFHIESVTGFDSHRILAAGVLQELFAHPQTVLQEIDGVPMAMTGFPLRDFHTSRNPDLKPSGMVLIWSTAIDQVAAFNKAVWVNIFYAMLGFCIVETLLFLSVQLITKHLQRIIFRRTEQLALAQDKLVDQARKVGMAEVATDLLHNVGNVLNSVTVGTGRLRENIVGSRIVGVKKIADLLGQQNSPTDNFLTESEMQDRLPAYLATLSEQLATEQIENLSQVDSLRKHIEHIITIVNSQQDHCSEQDFATAVGLRELLEETLELTQMGGNNCQIQVVWDIPELPDFLVDRHRLLQIMVNLTRNAGQAMSDPRNPDRTLRFRAQTTEVGTLLISVIDSGEGISPENLTQIFHHGFTTKDYGHGFGLHGAANSANEMGGKLIAHSEGPGKGAEFTLEIPFQPGGKIHV